MGAGHYDKAGNPIQINYPSGRALVQTFDQANRLTKITFTNAWGPYDYVSNVTYSPFGAPASFMLGNGLTETYTYNNRQQISSIRAANSLLTALNVSYNFYDSFGKNNGNVQAITDLLKSDRTQSFTYDELNRLKTAQSQATAGADCWGLSFGYDVWANLTSAGVTKCSAPTLSLAINAQNRMADAGYGYDLAGNLIAEPGRSYAYDAENRMTNMNSGAATYMYEVDGPRARKQVGTDWTEYFEFGGNVLFERNTTAGEWADYIYLNGKRIARAANYSDRLRIWGSHCSGCGTQYSRFSFPNAAGLAGYVIQSGDRLFFRQYQGVGRGGMELTFTDGTSTTGLVNDQDGIPINADTSTGVWKYRRVDLSGFAGKTVSDVALWVDSVTVGSWEIYYDWISLISTDGTVGPIYDRQKTITLTVSGPAGRSRNYQVNHWSGPASQTAADSYYHGDHLGSARVMTSHGGYQLWQATYLPYGQELNPQTTINRFKFTGKERDAESGLDYFSARYLGSNLGRFLSPDEFTGGLVDVFSTNDPTPPGPLPYATITNPQSLNKYTYTWNNPLRYVDPDGHDIKFTREGKTVEPVVHQMRKDSPTFDEAMKMFEGPVDIIFDTAPGVFTAFGPAEGVTQSRIWTVPDPRGGDRQVAIALEKAQVTISQSAKDPAKTIAHEVGHVIDSKKNPQRAVEERTRQPRTFSEYQRSRKERQARRFANRVEQERREAERRKKQREEERK